MFVSSGGHGNTAYCTYMYTTLTWPVPSMQHKTGIISYPSGKSSSVQGFDVVRVKRQGNRTVFLGTSRLFNLEKKKTKLYKSD